jgi:hypothetical protein
VKPPLFEEGVHLSLALEIEPEKDRGDVAVRFSEGSIGDEQPAIPSRNAGNAALLITPVEGETKSVHIIGRRLFDARRGNVGNGSGEYHGWLHLVQG